MGFYFEKLIFDRVNRKYVHTLDNFIWLFGDNSKAWLCALSIEDKASIVIAQVPYNNVKNSLAIKNNSNLTNNKPFTYNFGKKQVKKYNLSLFELKVAHSMRFEALSQAINVFLIESVYISTKQSDNNRWVHRRQNLKGSATSSMEQWVKCSSDGGLSLVQHRRSDKFLIWARFK